MKEVNRVLLTSDYNSDSDEAEEEDYALLQDVHHSLGTSCLNPNPNLYNYYNNNSDDDSDSDDLHLLQTIKQRSCIIINNNNNNNDDDDYTDDDDDDDDYETIRAVQLRCLRYNPQINNNNLLHLNLQTQARHHYHHHHVVAAQDTLQQSDDYHHNYFPLTATATATGLNLKNLKSFPESAQVLVQAIKKNRSLQKLLRNKLLINLEANIETNKDLIRRLKTLRNFDVSCKARTGRALSQNKDALIQLISRSSNKRSSSSMCRLDPPQNSHVVNYERVHSTELPPSREAWSNTDRENLANGIKQQFQQALLQNSIQLYAANIDNDDDDSAGGGVPCADNLDDIFASISDFEVTPENIRSFLPKVNWNQLASVHLVERCGMECEARWLNWEDPLINRAPWTKAEDKKLWHLVHAQNSIYNWIDTAVSMGTNRTPFQCLARYMRSLNPVMLNRDWTQEEDDKLSEAVSLFGEGNWQQVAAYLYSKENEWDDMPQMRRTGTQCSNRWKKSLNPARQRKGEWSEDEDKRLKVAVKIFGSRNWHKIEQFEPGRMQWQCRERWVCSLNPELKVGPWTEEEDAILKKAVEEHGRYWPKVAAVFKNKRTNRQCMRRWKSLFPDEVPALQEAMRIKKKVLMSNFVDRETERPAIDASDFLPLLRPQATSELPARRQKRRSRGRGESKVTEDGGPCCNASNNASNKRQSKRPRGKAQICSEEAPQIRNE